MMKEYSYQERLMGTTASLSFICPTQGLAEQMAQDGFVQLRAAEREFSRFLPDSALSKLNTTGTQVVSPLFFQVMQTALTLHDLTEGAFNPLVQVATLGYTTAFVQLPSTSILKPIIYDSDLSKLKIDPQTHTITLAPTQQLDLGGLLKGYLAHQLADYFKQTYPTCHGCIVNIGGDLSTRGTDELHEPFMFELYNPITTEEILIPLMDTSLATSGTYARRWKTENGTKHHLVDPTTHDNSISDLVAVSIVHQDGATAEALTKLYIARGVTAAIQTMPPSIHQYQYFCVDQTGTRTSSFL